MKTSDAYDVKKDNKKPDNYESCKRINASWYKVCERRKVWIYIDGFWYTSTISYSSYIRSKDSSLQPKKSELSFIQG